MDYKSAGVDVEAGRAFVQRIRTSVESTHSSAVLGGLGGFGGVIRLPAGMRRPLLVSGTDGVGTKLELAQAHQRHHDVGLDLVAMCVNDVVTAGAAPLFFLDYVATGALAPEAMAEVIEGISAGCRQSGCALLGGETAEMPGFYPDGRYDLAGFCVAVVDEDELIDGRLIQPGDRVIGIASSGVHSNGFSLVRKVLERAAADDQTRFGAEQRGLIDALLTPTVLYPKLVRELLDAGLNIHGMAHITGGGLPENLPRCLPMGTTINLDVSAWPRPEIFEWLQTAGDIPEADLWNTFNLGIGFCLVLPKGMESVALQQCEQGGHKAWLIGEVCEAEAGSAPALSGLPTEVRQFPK